MLKKIKELFALDLRSLALYRIAMSVFILGDLAIRATDLRAHYTDWGLLPRHALVTPPLMNMWRFSLHLMSGTAWAEALLFVIAAVFALMLLVGFRTKTASIAIWILTLSLQARNPAVLQGGDVLFRMALFFGMFLPLNGCWSVDRALDTSGEEKPACAVSAGTTSFSLQVMFVYLFTVGVKLTKPESRAIWWNQGLAVYNVLNVDQFTRPFGYFLLNLPLGVLKFLNYYVLTIETLSPFLLLIPVKNVFLRSLFVLLIIHLHIGLGLSLSLGPFPFLGIITVLPLIPGEVWEKSIFKKIDRFFISLQEKVVERFAGKIPAWPVKIRLNLLSQIIALVSIFYIFCWNMGTIGAPVRIPYQIQPIGNFLQFDQYWDMFSPPLKDDGWYVIPGRLRNGQEIDVFQNGRPIRWEKPARVSLMYKHERWRKYMTNLWLARNKDYRLYYGQYLCRSWNDHHKPEDALEEFEIVFMQENTLSYQTAAPKKVSIWRHYCFSVPDPLPPSRWVEEKK